MLLDSYHSSSLASPASPLLATFRIAASVSQATLREIRLRWSIASHQIQARYDGALLLGLKDMLTFCHVVDCFSPYSSPFQRHFNGCKGASFNAICCKLYTNCRICQTKSRIFYSVRTIERQAEHFDWIPLVRTPSIGKWISQKIVRPKKSRKLLQARRLE